MNFNEASELGGRDDWLREDYLDKKNLIFNFQKVS
jgi:hypothetical protein